MGGQPNQVYSHPAFSKDGNINYSRSGNLYIDSNIQMKPLKMSYQGNRNK